MPQQIERRADTGTTRQLARRPSWYVRFIRQSGSQSEPPRPLRKSDFWPNRIYTGLGSHAYRRKSDDSYLCEEGYNELPD